MDQYVLLREDSGGNDMIMEKAGCIGAGLIGHSWATLFAWKGFDVALHDFNEEALRFALTRINLNLNLLKEKGLLKDESCEDCIERIRITNNLTEAISEADYIQESVYENYRTKKEVFKKIDSAAPPNAIIASSTSTLKMTDIQKAVRRPTRCIVAHPWNPPHLMPLIDIIPGKKTSKETINMTQQLMEDLGKVTVVQKKETAGAVSNRLSAALWREAIDLVHKDVVELEDVDKAVTAGSAFRWAVIGPNLGYHLGGGSGGIKYFLHHIGPTMETRWRSLAKWISIPEGAKRKIIESIENTKLVREKSMEEIIRWRDEKFVELLKMFYKY